MMRFLSITVLILWSPPGQATERRLEDGAPEQAEQRYQIGVDAYRDGRFEDAAREFRVAFTVFPRSSRLAYNLARSLERSGKVEEAVRFYGEYLRLSPKAEDREAVEATVAGLRQVLEGRGGTLEISSKPAGAQVEVDGRPLGMAPTTAAVPAGEHLVEATLDGFQPVRRFVVVEAGGTAAAEMVLSAEELDWRPVAGWSGVGLGVATITAGVIFSAVANGHSEDAKGLVQGEDDEFDALQDDYDGAVTAMTASYIAGGVLMSAGAVLLLWPDDEATQTTAILGPGSVTLGGRF